MATGTKSSKLVIQLGDGGTPTETFAFTCGANSWTVNLTNNVGEAISLDCTDPLGEVAVLERFLESQDTSITLSGKVTTEAWSTWRGWADGGTAKNTKVFFDEAAGVGGGYWIVPMFLTGLELAKEGSATVDFSATLAAAGSRVWTDAS